MKIALTTIAGLALAGSALAGIDPTRPMVTGHGNVSLHPQKVIVTNQTAAAPQDETVALEKFVVTGSLIHVRPAKAKGK